MSTIRNEEEMDGFCEGNKKGSNSFLGFEQDELRKIGIEMGLTKSVFD